MPLEQAHQPRAQLERVGRAEHVVVGALAQRRPPPPAGAARRPGPAGGTCPARARSARRDPAGSGCAASTAQQHRGRLDPVERGQRLGEAGHAGRLVAGPGEQRLAAARSMLRVPVAGRGCAGWGRPASIAGALSRKGQLGQRGRVWPATRPPWPIHAPRRRGKITRSSIGPRRTWNFEVVRAKRRTRRGGLDVPRKSRPRSQESSLVVKFLHNEHTYQIDPDRRKVYAASWRSRPPRRPRSSRSGAARTPKPDGLPDPAASPVDFRGACASLLGCLLWPSPRPPRRPAATLTGVGPAGAVDWSRQLPSAGLALPLSRAERWAPRLPDLSIPPAGWRRLRPRTQRGKVVVLDVWASWCAPCRIELPHLQALAAAERERGLVAIAVNAQEPEAELGGPRRQGLQHHAAGRSLRRLAGRGARGAQPARGLPPRPAGAAPRRWDGYRSGSSRRSAPAPARCSRRVRAALPERFGDVLSGASSLEARVLARPARSRPPGIAAVPRAGGSRLILHVARGLLALDPTAR